MLLKQHAKRRQKLELIVITLKHVHPISSVLNCSPFFFCGIAGSAAAPGFTEKLTAQIINNLQVKIANLHVRYEDSSTTGRPFAFGVTLSELEVFTTDDKWEKAYMTERATTVFKIANLSCLACYFNCHGNLFYGEDTSKLLEPFKTNIACRDFRPQDFYYGKCCIS